MITLLDVRSRTRNTSSRKPYLHVWRDTAPARDIKANAAELRGEQMDVLESADEQKKNKNEGCSSGAFLCHVKQCRPQPWRTHQK